MIVVSDTSPITNLSAIGCFDLLHALFGEIHLPRQVVDELSAFGQRWPGADEVENADWVHIHEVDNPALLQALLRDLDAGEAAGIVLALNLNADLILIDERDGRHAAERLGLNVVGTVGLLIQGKASGFLMEVRPKLDALREAAGFYLSDSLYHEVLRLAQE